MNSDDQVYDAARLAIASLNKAWMKTPEADGVPETTSRLAEQDISKAAFVRSPASLKPVVHHLEATLQEARSFATEIAAALAVLAPALRWMQSASYTDEVLGAGFSENYAWCELIGAQGFFKGDDFNLGFLLLGPGRHYRDHYHPAPELYWPLTAHSFWKKGASAFVERRQGEVIWHPSMEIHATITREKPLLAAFAWTREAHIGARLCATDGGPGNQPVAG